MKKYMTLENSSDAYMSNEVKELLSSRLRQPLLRLDMVSLSVNPNVPYAEKNANRKVSS